MQIVHCLLLIMNYTIDFAPSLLACAFFPFFLFSFFPSSKIPIFDFKQGLLFLQIREKQRLLTVYYLPAFLED